MKLMTVLLAGVAPSVPAQVAPATAVPSAPQILPPVQASIPPVPAPSLQISPQIEIQLGGSTAGTPVSPPASPPSAAPSASGLPPTAVTPLSVTPVLPRADGRLGPPTVPGIAVSPGSAVTLPQLPASPQLDALLGLSGSATTARAEGAQSTADRRRARFAELVRRHPGQIALDPDGFPARAHEVVVSDPSDRLVTLAHSRGFRVIERSSVLGAGYARLRTPAAMDLRAAIEALKALGARDVTADQLHFPNGARMASSGAAAPPPAARRAAARQSRIPTVGMIDGGIAGGGANGVIVQRGFAAGAPQPSDHGTAIASLIAGRGLVKGGAPGARLMAADVYGSDPAGGSATAIVRALGWLAQERVPVVTISLAGPQNPLLARVVSAAQRRGMILVAAVGNGGPTSGFAYPASYPGVVAVTAVDGRNRLLIEAGRARHLDYAAPGADMLAVNARGMAVPVRGTSFAAPLVAARIASHYATADRPAALARVDAEAQPLGRGYGRGLVCGRCRTPVR